jgi:hypothetical protein
MTKDELLDSRRRALNLLQAYEAGDIMNLDSAAPDDLTNHNTEVSIIALRAQIAELERRIAGHPDQDGRLQSDSPS